MGPTFLVSELAYATDVAVQVNFDLEQLESDKEKREFLSQYTTSPPEYARNLESIIPSEVMKAAKTKKIRIHSTSPNHLMQVLQG